MKHCRHYYVAVAAEDLKLVRSRLLTVCQGQLKADFAGFFDYACFSVVAEYFGRLDICTASKGPLCFCHSVQVSHLCYCVLCLLRLCC